MSSSNPSKPAGQSRNPFTGYTSFTIPPFLQQYAPAEYFTGERAAESSPARCHAKVPAGDMDENGVMKTTSSTTSNPDDEAAGREGWYHQLAMSIDPSQRSSPNKKTPLPAMHDGHKADFPCPSSAPVRDSSETKATQDRNISLETLTDISDQKTGLQPSPSQSVASGSSRSKPPPSSEVPTVSKTFDCSAGLSIREGKKPMGNTAPALPALGNDLRSDMKAHAQDREDNKTDPFDRPASSFGSTEDLTLLARQHAEAMKKDQETQETRRLKELDPFNRPASGFTDADAQAILDRKPPTVMKDASPPEVQKDSRKKKNFDSYEALLEAERQALFEKQEAADLRRDQVIHAMQSRQTHPHDPYEYHRRAGYESIRHGQPQYNENMNRTQACYNPSMPPAYYTPGLSPLALLRNKGDIKQDMTSHAARNDQISGHEQPANAETVPQWQQTHPSMQRHGPIWRERARGVEQQRQDLEEYRLQQELQQQHQRRLRQQHEQHLQQQQQQQQHVHDPRSSCSWGSMSTAQWHHPRHSSTRNDAAEGRGRGRAEVSGYHPIELRQEIPQRFSAPPPDRPVRNETPQSFIAPPPLRPVEQNAAALGSDDTSNQLPSMMTTTNLRRFDDAQKKRLSENVQKLYSHSTAADDGHQPSSSSRPKRNPVGAVGDSNSSTVDPFSETTTTLKETFPSIHPITPPAPDGRRTPALDKFRERRNARLHAALRKALPESTSSSSSLDDDDPWKIRPSRSGPRLPTCTPTKEIVASGSRESFNEAGFKVPNSSPTEQVKQQTSSPEMVESPRDGEAQQIMDALKRDLLPLAVASVETESKTCEPSPEVASASSKPSSVSSSPPSRKNKKTQDSHVSTRSKLEILSGNYQRVDESSTPPYSCDATPFNRPQVWGEFGARYSPPIGSAKISAESLPDLLCAECGVLVSKMCEHEVEKLGWVDARDECGGESGFETDVDNGHSEEDEWDLV